ncbi:hypothetical protein AGMMS50218_05670 [Actinomycetota bacterium]|nr:hypothetical protein AGMMS50218_05670 [Actinomycetota bacterium]
MSFDDHPLASWLRPGLTSFAIPHEALGRSAVELLLTSVTDPGRTDAARPADASPIRRLPMPLRERGSVAPSA